MKANKRA